MGGDKEWADMSRISADIRMALSSDGALADAVKTRPRANEGEMCC
jgi:hypothetical protein